MGYIDYATGVEARVFPLYYIPIGIGALRVSHRFGVGLSVLSTALWAAGRVASDAAWTPGILTFNILMQFSSFGVVAFLVAGIRGRYDLERELSRRDTLTGLSNSRAFYELAELLLAGARRSERPLTIAYLDLDNFKAVNDTRGHLEGDLALQATAEILRTGTRGSDVVARLGGDEFAVLLPETGPDAARMLLERLHDAHAAAMGKHDWPITASIGAITFLRAPGSVEAAVQGADALMYRAKHEGKSRVVLEAAGLPPD